MPSESDQDNGVPGADTDESCPTCHQYFDKEDECWGNYVPLTRDEEAILARMREVKAEVGAVKKRLKEIEGKNGFQVPIDGQDSDRVSDDQALWQEQKQLMATLREEWQKLDLRRQEAASFRMKILGHED
jgi:predicted nuclease with TOPRIM domain